MKTLRQYLVVSLCSSLTFSPVLLVAHPEKSTVFAFFLAFFIGIPYLYMSSSRKIPINIIPFVASSFLSLISLITIFAEFILKSSNSNVTLVGIILILLFVTNALDNIVNFLYIKKNTNQTVENHKYYWEHIFSCFFMPIFIWLCLSAFQLIGNDSNSITLLTVMAGSYGVQDMKHIFSEIGELMA
ncbi:hypothetical protein [Leuconostoc citreum]|uniref:hypothetical protein n=1 Tax=Leuconostoc citreum TaxID=33964 RepID=UPI003C376837